MALSLENNQIQIIQVWNDNLEKEFAVIRKIVDDYPNIAMVINFPGVVVRPGGNFKTNSDYNYQTLKANVDVLKLIQLGLTFSDEVGNLPTCGIGKGCVWQFNFREFNLSEDLYENDSIELLHQSGINFEMNNTRGIDVQKFAELLMSSGVVLNKDVNIITFDGGYNFGYLVKLLKGMNLPDTLSEFYLWGKTYFPTFYDIKHLMSFCDGLDDGLDLNKLAEILGEERMGNCRQAGSHSLLTSATFKKMKESFFHGSTEIKAGVLYGLSVEN